MQPIKKSFIFFFQLEYLQFHCDQTVIIWKIFLCCVRLECSNPKLWWWPQVVSRVKIFILALLVSSWKFKKNEKFQLRVRKKVKLFYGNFRYVTFPTFKKFDFICSKIVWKMYLYTLYCSKKIPMKSIYPWSQFLFRSRSVSWFIKHSS